MNSDPYDSAAWRSFGMLDADESAIFDEAMRHDPLLRSASLDMDRLSAAVAVATTTPVAPRAGQLERLQSRLGLNPSRRAFLWLGLSGWATAAMLALLLAANLRKETKNTPTPQAQAPGAGQTVSPQPSSTVQAGTSNAATPPAVTPDTPAPAVPIVRKTEADPRKIARVETRRLTQEIEVLRDSLEQFQQRDRILFEAIPGMALPVIMKMNPPGLEPETDHSIAANDSNSPVSHLLADTLRHAAPPSMEHANGDVTTTGPGPSATGGHGKEPPPSGIANPTDVPALPSAIPIYDAARDAGTLVVSNLPPAPPGKAYNLWVATSHGDKPVFVGSLPEFTGARSESFDFNLGSNMVLPSGFALTEDPVEKPGQPNEANTILRGPPTPPR